MLRPPSDRTPRALAAALVALFVVLALATRARGLDALVPQLMNRDGLVHVRQTEIFQGRTDDPDAAKILSVNPHLFSRIAALGPRLPEPGPQLTLERALELSRALWLRLRWISLAIALLAIPATYRLARVFLDRGGALFASGLVATSLLHFLNSTQEKAHAVATSFVLLALLGALRVRRKPDAKSYALFGVPAALGVGSLHNGLISLPALPVAWLLRDQKAQRGALAWVLLPVALVALSVRVFWPFLFDGTSAAVAAARGGSSPTSAFLRVFTPSSYTWARFETFFGDLWRHEPLLVTCSMAGILLWTVAAIQRRTRLRDVLRGDLAVVLVFTLPYFFSMCFLVSTSARYAMPVVPVFACAGGYAFSRATRWLARLANPAASPAASIGGVVASLGALLAIPAVPQWHLGTIRARPDTLEECAAWIAANVEPGARIVVYPTFDVPLLPTDEALEENTREPWETGWAEFLARGYVATVDAPRFGILVQPGVRAEARQDLLKDPARFYRRFEAQYAVLATPDENVYRSARSWLSRNAQRIARFSPRANEDGRWLTETHVLFHTEAADPALWQILPLRAIGPTVEIYRLP